jgi:peptidoglycan hydrolase-like protein with peptidoglycan-binding domain
MINDLLAQVAQLQGQTTPTTGGTMTCDSFLMDHGQGSEGAEVMRLQQFLNMDQDTRVAAAGMAGSAGMETQYYGPATAAAVSKFQVKYRAEILSPLGLVNPTGYWGAGSRAKANALCSETVVTTPDTDEDATDEDEDEDMDEEDEARTLSGEASLDDFSMDGAEDTELEEGSTDAPIAEATFEFTNGDAELSRINIALTGSGDEQDPWDVFESLSLWVDGDKIAEKDADDEDDYLNENSGTFRFSNLDLFMEEDEEVEIVIAATLQDNLDGVSDGEAWTVQLDSIRFFDADGVAITEDNGSFGNDFGETESFTIEEAGYEDEIRIRTSSNDPEATTLQLEDNSDSDDYTVFIFDIDTDDSINDIEIDSIPVTVNLSSSTFDAIVDDAELVIDGVTIDDYTVVGGGSATAVLTFDVDGDVVIDAGDRVSAELILTFNALVAGNEGMTVDAEVTSTNANNIDAEGADDLTNTGTDQLSGSADGETHTLRTTGIDVSKESTSAVVTVVDSGPNDYGTYEVEVEVTAFEQDVFISTDPAVSMGYDLQDGAGSSSVAGSRSVTLVSSADEGGAGNAFFEISEGQTETLTLTITYTPGVANTASRLVLQDITFDETGTVITTDDKTQTTLPASDYRTKVVTMVN